MYETMHLAKIPVRTIRPFPEQPRKRFDETALNELACSIQEAGQRTPITVKPISGDPVFKYELIDGERRLRAHKKIGLQTIIAIITTVKNIGEQHVQSVVSNFCREKHSSMEIAYALEKMRDYYKKEDKTNDVQTILKIGKVVGKSGAWVYSYLSLLNLCPKVRAMVDAGKIQMSIAKPLASFTHKAQMEVANLVVKKNLDFKRALMLIRNLHKPENLGENARHRRPSDDYDIIRASLKRIALDSEVLLGMKISKAKAALGTRNQKDIKNLQKTITKVQDGLSSIADLFQKILVQ